MSADEPSGDNAEIADGIIWRDGNVPYSRQFGDIYYNPKNGLAETQYVFVAGNNLPEAWQNRENFTIGETGFGTGLNFLAAWDCWQKDPARSRRLHFVSVEKFPLTRDAMARAHQNWPELADISRQLVAQWPTGTMLPGVHRFGSDDGSVTLTLLIGDAIDCYRDYHGTIDCWFLDGFAPSRNPDMWRPELFNALAAASSHDGATLATFSAARIVRDGLEQAGFEINKRKGYAYKRDMITARLAPRDTPDQDTSGKGIDQNPWFVLPKTTGKKQIAVIGGGMAGAACAHALHNRGCAVTLFEKSDHLADAASGNPIGMLEPYLTVDDAITGRFYEAGFRYSQRLVRTLAEAAHIEAGFCGVLDLISGPRDEERQAGLINRLGQSPDLVRLLDREESSTIFGLPLPHGGLFYPDAGWVNPPSLVSYLARGIECHTRANIVGIFDDGDGKVVKSADDREFGPFDAIIIAGATETGAFYQTDWLADYLRPVRGQISYFDEGVLRDCYGDHPIRCVLSHKGYLTPARNGIHVFGATFGRDDSQTDLREDDHAFNVRQLGKVLPKLADVLDPAALSGRAALRTTTPDHLPVVGPAPDYGAYLLAYADIDKGKKAARYVDATYHKDVYICTGFGARGLIAAPLAAEIIASEICNMPLPLEKSLMDALHPARFIVRGLKRRQITA
ncbi:bifunctional tRNA (5-methylaminomethyl-2-thiouridine)(34)-methyltransferase MnmD/FAD-dependent 5-carboxymethylaminomethyl-2-thiouridine(34) oxidoreductase MnmC [Thalassospira lucentensis]|uniref:bifunctional tRNA (5-methylaminomethyl-2-thiouridine)(34)-methyltransferase MnmD/FAD-dependent 5-carboxymethylaminomethyl-2-thiouridine(34) oxidoreductase MnmC n=1 Tax=Thalassospira lucentensis TaxID=168935 RepID=UPI002941E385|nr:bifunctional tRNA (5-methylaminomethyl-2-thiouridine)(34)-methyltransferase MnmD/FAD-dependent 5-carboxymethylaminomethyl-2-thiouridine(34) oxidoreductase MnmC [Thalassospira lucentensis]WOI10281.1 bifunctional tRNA (5-methylaminomethyl-2-thiouridine)(34)-methyltransferase MnmD/FAD-dependent 5-carboxymethylaminomethyl-2-thiouridine(34) oxidoreductase MnmC [Thalassospira lucentensis]